MRKVELLSPAGNFEALRGAIGAGADAVYLGGERYGARAYADNFSTDEICEGIRLAHTFGKKIYLTVNTLVKEKELDSLYYFMLPFYEKGLDGVIVQDFGVLRFLKKYFPGLSLHASTQMTITGTKGAALVQKEGISRIVPARELSLEELVFIKQETGVEIEAFIHGAMCYCYSGQCLFSSLLGGRSGNRGRCAQPCRLPYQAAGDNRQQISRMPENRRQDSCSSSQSCYPLSMKDMCTIELIPQLIEAGIDSFKIEGRMKNPAYAAGVTAVYRKYIDLYYQDKENYQVSEKDKELLGSLYIRSETGDGYYRKRNGREMISLSSPAYSQTDEALLTSIRQKYIEPPLFHRAKAKVCLKAGERAELTLEAEGVKVSCKGDEVQQALKQPLTLAKIEEQLKKNGNSLIRIEQLNVEGAENIFMPIRALNELRRSTTAALEEEIIRSRAFAGERHAVPFVAADSISASKPAVDAVHSSESKGQPSHASQAGLPGHSSGQELHLSVMTREQLKAACAERAQRIYVDYGLLDEIDGMTSKKESELYAVTPYIVREKDKKYLERIQELFSAGVLKGVLVRNLESAAFLCETIPESRIVLDANLYIWNREALTFWEMYGGEFYLPAECNGREWEELLDACKERRIKASAMVYGRLPMMVTANCVRKTIRKCSHERGIILLEDRYRKQFPVYSDCLCCYNIIYNSIPLSLHRQLSGKLTVDGNYRLDFTVEKEDETRQIIRSFRLLTEEGRRGASGRGNSEKAENPDLSYKEYTTGHYKRGVE